MPKHLFIQKIAGPLLPVLAGILTVVSLAAQNANKTAWGDVWLPTLLAGTFGLIMWAVFMIIPFFRRAAPLSSTYIVLITMFWTSIPFTPALPLMVGVPFIVLVSAISQSHKIIPVATAIFALACVMSLGIFTFSGRTVQASNSTTDIKLINTPDIYFIVPDRFPSPDALRETGENPDAFIQALRDLGFYVREDGLSQDTFTPTTKASYTTRTLRFMASVLNMGVDIDFDIPYLEAGGMVKNPEVARILQSNGYVYHHIGSWFPETAYSLVADYNYIYPSYSVSSRLNSSLFASAVIDRSGFRALNFVPFLTDSARAKIETKRQIYQISTFEDIADNNDSPKFVFLHLLLPHPDYYWMADGSSSDTSMSPQARYMQQVEFTETKLMEMINSLHNPQAIIIIQSDEGMAYTDMALNKQLSNVQWNGTLSAWRIPGSDEEEFNFIQNVDILRYVIEELKCY